MIFISKMIKKSIGILIFLAGLTIVFHVYTLFMLFPGMDLSRMRAGIASWYSEKDPAINKHTANNEIFDDEADTCATWHYRFHENLLVFNLFNAQWTLCRVNDRGPAKRLKREVDLTKAAFQKIANSRKGLIPVVVVPINKPRNGSK